MYPSKVTPSTCIEEIAFPICRLARTEWKYLEFAPPSLSHLERDCCKQILTFNWARKWVSDEIPWNSSKCASDRASSSSFTSRTDNRALKESILLGKFWVWATSQSLSAPLINLSFYFRIKPPQPSICRDCNLSITKFWYPRTSLQHFSIHRGQGPNFPHWSIRLGGNDPKYLSTGPPAYNWAKSNTSLKKAGTCLGGSSWDHPF
jgi:hypothetical protein